MHVHCFLVPLGQNVLISQRTAASLERLAGLARATRVTLAAGNLKNARVLQVMPGLMENALTSTRATPAHAQATLMLSHVLTFQLQMMVQALVEIARAMPVSNSHHVVVVCGLMRVSLTRARSPLLLDVMIYPSRLMIRSTAVSADAWKVMFTPSMLLAQKLALMKMLALMEPAVNTTCAKTDVHLTLVTRANANQVTHSWTHLTLTESAGKLIHALIFLAPVP